jgi:hypothetical protein
VPQDALSHEIIENDLACGSTKPEQARGLGQVKGQAWHFPVRSCDHRLELLTRRLAGYGIAPTRSAL